MTRDSAKPLTCGDAVVGFVTVKCCDMFWLIGEFTAGPAYEYYAALFERERELSKQDEQSSDEWMDALDKINVLELRFDGCKIRDFNIDDHGECEFKLDDEA